jgi:hypothetical protein
MSYGSPTTKQVATHAVFGAAVCFAGFSLADIAGTTAPALWNAAAEKWILLVVGCSYCSVGAALTGLIFLASKD